MKTLDLSEPKARLSELCDEVLRSGEGVVISRRGRPIAHIMPLPKSGRQTEESIWDTVRRLDEEYAGCPEEPDFELPRGQYTEHCSQ